MKHLKSILKLIKHALIAALLTTIGGCGGGGGDTPQKPIENGPVFVGPAVSIKLSEEIPKRIGHHTKKTLRLLAIDASGTSIDVTRHAKIFIDEPKLASLSLIDGDLQFETNHNTGSVSIKISYESISMELTTWVTWIAHLPAPSHLEMKIQEPLAGLVPNPDGSYSVLPGKEIWVLADAFISGVSHGIGDEVVVTSSDPNVLIYHTAEIDDGRYSYGYTLNPGTVTLTAKWSDFTAHLVVHVGPAFLLEKPQTSASGLTENDSGRTTAYVHYLEEDRFYSKLAFVESDGNNQWGVPKLIPIPDSTYHLIAYFVAAESPNGYRAIVATDVTEQKWIYLISPTGALVGPTIIPKSAGRDIALFVSNDGNAHVWFQNNELTRLNRKVFEFNANGRMVDSYTVNIAPDPYQTARVSKSIDGTVVLTWITDNCRINYLFDNLSNQSQIAPTISGSTNIGGCNEGFFQLFAGYNVAAGRGEFASVILHANSPDPFERNGSTYEVMSVDSSHIVKRITTDPGETLGSDIAINENGQVLVAWFSRDHSVRAIHRDLNGQFRGPFLVEPEFDSNATGYLHGVYSRGDGRFVIAWVAGTAFRTSLELREYSESTGVGPLKSFNHQSPSETPVRHIIATRHGISAAWDRASLFGDKFYAFQHFLP